MIYRLILAIFIFLIISCKKLPEENSNIPNPFNQPHLTLKFNGNKRQVPACGSSAYFAEYLRDTTFFVGFGCAGERIGFYLKGNIDGSYILDNHNTSYYSEDHSNSFRTDSLHKGVLTILTERNNNITNIRGTFKYDGFDSATGNSCKITEGEFLLEKH